MRAFVKWGTSLVCAVAACAAVSASAQDTSACAAPAPPPAELAAWTTPRAMQAAATLAQSGRAALPIGQAARLALLQTPQVRYPLRPEKPGGAVSYGGLARIDVAETGTYRIALGSAAWIDLVRDSRAATSSAHGHGPDCAGIRKMVDFVLSPGRYTLQIAANGQPETTVLVVRLP